MLFSRGASSPSRNWVIVLDLKMKILVDNTNLFLRYSVNVEE